MAKWCTSLVLLVALTGAMAGVPLHSGEQGCAMTAMRDCCRKAQSQSNAPAVQAARLCCALNCTSPVTTTTASNFQFSPSITVVLHGTAVSTPLAVSSVNLLRSNSPHGCQQDSHPAYILNLAL